MLDEEKKSCKCCWWKVLCGLIMIFIVTFLAFHLALSIMFNKMFSPEYNARRLEKMLIQQEREFQKFENKAMKDPFEIKVRPMLVNLVQEEDEYKLVVDLRQLDNNEKGISFNLDNNVATVSGEMEKKAKNSERIVNFSQSYYLNNKLIVDKIKKERKGDKYIITIPFED